LVFKIFLKIRNIRFVGNLILSTTFEFCYGDFTVTLFTNIQLATLLLKASRNEQRSVLHVWLWGLWTNWDWKCYHTHYTVQTWPPVTIIFLGQWRKC